MIARSCAYQVLFDLGRCDIERIVPWLLQLPKDHWSLVKNELGRILGVEFEFEADALTFRLAFGM